MLIIGSSIIRLVLALNLGGTLEFTIEFSLQAAFTLELLFECKLSILNNSVERVLVCICGMGRYDAALFNLENKFKWLRFTLIGESTLKDVLSNW